MVSKCCVGRNIREDFTQDISDIPRIINLSPLCFFPDSMRRIVSYKDTILNVNFITNVSNISLTLDTKE